MSGLLGAVVATEPAKTEAWSFQAVVYGYLPTVDGTTTFSGGDGGTDVGTDAGSILDSLQFVFMGALDRAAGAGGPRGRGLRRLRARTPTTGGGFYLRRRAARAA